MFQGKPLLKDFETLPPEKQAEDVDFIPFLKTRQVQQHKEKHPFGVLKGKVCMSDDFDAPLEEFAEYM